jgi:hypothetical protein
MKVEETKNCSCCSNEPKDTDAVITTLNNDGTVDTQDLTPG